MNPTHAVWYHSAGCLPDGDGPEFEGSLEECVRWVEAWAHEYVSDAEHNLYSLYIEKI